VRPTASRSFVFTRDSERLVGVLYLPAGQALAAVVTTGPLTSVKEQATGAYARALAERGFAALAFDHRSFGESEGEPRQFEHPEGKARDVSAAVTALGTDERTRALPVVAVGICAGGGYMARAVADDERNAALAGVAGVYLDAAPLARSSLKEYRAAIDRGLAAEQRWHETGTPEEVIPAVPQDGGDVAMPVREACEFYGTPRGAVDNYTNGFAVQSSRTRHRSTPKRPRPGSGCRSCSSTPSMLSLLRSRAVLRVRARAKGRSLVGVSGSD
jgi:fermentation-respiration switch protein FrsA (DUF1100 family)